MNTTNAKYADWLTTHTLDNCLLDRANYIDFVSNYIIGEHDGFVLNLNGSWGTGKTEFLKRQYTNLLNKGHPTIYIDSWSSDFSKDPLSVVMSELLSQLEALTEGIGEAKQKALFESVKSVGGALLKGTLVGVAGYATNKITGEAGDGMAIMQTMLGEDNAKVTTTLQESYKEQMDAIANIKIQLSQLAEVLATTYGGSKPVVVLVDELDRCRPTYAIEMLEVIKHFFTTENLVFVIATDTEQLSHSIKAVYGNDFDSQQYLKRFFDRKVTLPEPDIEHYLKAKSVDFSAYSDLDLFPYKHRQLSFCIGLIAKAYDLKIRDVDQLTTKLESCLRSILQTKTVSGKKQFVNICALIIGIIEQDKSFSSYTDREPKKASHTNAIKPFTIEDNFVADTLIQVSMDCVVTHLDHHYDGFDGTESRYILPTFDNLNARQTEPRNAEQRSFFDSMRHGISNYTNGHVKYWFWHDLKKLIELAGTIE